MNTPWYRWEGEDLILRLRVQARAAKTELTGTHAGRLKLRITAPPVDGKANEAIIAFFAELCGVAKSHISLIVGTTGREKTLRIQTPRRLPPGVLSSPPASDDN